MSGYKFATGAYSSKYTTDQSTLWFPRKDHPIGLRYGIIACHGHGGGATGWVAGYQQYEQAGAWAQALANAGFYVLAVDHARINSWSDPDAMDSLDDAYTYLTTTIGCNSKIGLIGPSMGGAVALNWIKANPSKVSAMYGWAPLTDLDWVRSTAGYTPTYNTGGVTPDGSWAAEVDSTFGPTLVTTKGAAYLTGKRKPTRVPALFENFDGVGNNVAISTGNSIFTAISGGGTSVGDTGDVPVGQASLKVATTIAVQQISRGFTASNYQVRAFLFKLDNLPSANSYLSQFTSGGTIRCQVGVNTAGNIRLRGGTDGVTQVAITGSAYSTNTWYLGVYTLDTTTSPGSCSFLIYDWSTGALLDTLSGAAPSSNVTFDTWYIGVNASATWTLHFAGVQMDTVSLKEPYLVMPITSAVGGMPADPTRNSNGYQSLWTTGAGTGSEFRYIARDDTHLYGAYDGAGSGISVANGGSLYGRYAEQSNGYRIRDERSSWNGLGVRIHLTHGQADATLPIDATRAFVSGAADANVDLTEYPGRTHTDLVLDTPPAELVTFFRKNLGYPLTSLADLTGWRWSDLKNTRWADLGGLLP